MAARGVTPAGRDDRGDRCGVRMRPPGRLILVGAGPGAADLLTMRAVHALQEADVVLHDRLVSDEVLDLIPGRVERIFVGKIHGRSADATQEWIHGLIAVLVRSGRVVVRLKGGDPCVFARGGEEWSRAAAAGIAVQVVPGITSAISAPALAGIPVTMRGVASAFAVFSAQEAASGLGAAIDWSMAAAAPTAVFLMGVRRLPEIVQQLVAHGRRPATAVAIIESASLPGQRTVVGTLENIVGRCVGVRAPATIVVGEVVKLRASASSDPEVFAQTTSRVTAPHGVRLST
ncbi:MAG: uroporphyrinogen-III C-methyltransferase [Nannocystaceae bacterium]